MVEIHSLRAADHEAVLALAARLLIGVAPWRDASAVERTVVDWVRQAVDGHDPDSCPVFVAADAGEVVGFVAAGTRRHWSGDTDAYVGELVTVREAEGRGIGAALMTAAEAWASERGFTRMTLETGAANARAIGFYRHRGYDCEEVVLTRSITPRSHRAQT